MSDSDKPTPGTIGWTDLTVENAEEIREFYQAVAGWTSSAVDMGGYSDYNMEATPGDPTVGICHARGANANLPPQWLIYIVVEDLDASLSSCKEKGGEIINGPRSIGAARYCVIRDPAGAVCALYQA